MFPGNDTPYIQRYDLVADKGAAGPGSDRGIWRIPSLRNVAITGPWLHNGSVDKLEEVVRIMATSQLAASVDTVPQPGRTIFWSPADHSVSKVDRPVLSNADIKDIVAFEGVRENQLIGYGIVVGLNGTGDSLRNAPMTKQSLEAMLRRWLAPGTRDSGAGAATPPRD